jgi:EAL domain-containing protein (putative c-di-GMP-specific phosphodiesterase class I)/FixJ family two-component response regulator
MQNADGSTVMADISTDEPSRLVFVLDDDAKVGAIVCKMLTALDVPNRHFADPIEFLTQVRVCSPELIILDLALGQSDAVDVIRKLEVVRFRGRVLLVSGSDATILAEAERIGRCHGLRMLAPLQKPIRVADLESSLQASAAPPSAQSRTDGKDNRRRSNRVSADLAQALKEGWLEVWYQPKIDLKDLTVCGAEALVRVRHPTNGIIQPIDFLPPASDPLYKPLTTFVLKRTMSTWAALSERGFPLKLAVNIPASVLSAPGFVDVLRRMLPTDDTFPGVVLEITEDDIIRDPEWLREIATQVRLCKATISIDDFGSAYASLSRLKDLPFNELKLDCSFVSGCAADPLKRSLCQTVVDLGHRLNASVCAEGIETEADLVCLRNQSFDTAQGFLFAKPMPSAEFMTFLAGAVRMQPELSEPLPRAVARG